MFLCVFLRVGDRAPARGAEYVARENALFIFSVCAALNLLPFSILARDGGQ